MQLVATWLTGPDSGGRHEVGGRRTIVGTAGIRCDDPDLLTHHALLEAASDGLWLTQLAGATPITVSGVPVTGRWPVGLGAPIRLAGSTLVVDHGAPDDTIDHSPPMHPMTPTTTPATHRIVRSPRSATPVGAPSLQPTGDRRDADRSDPGPTPPERERPGGLLPTLVGLVGSGVLAIATRRPMFMAFGAIGAAVACSSWLGQWIAFRRRYRRDSAEYAAHAARLADERRARHTAATAALRDAAPGVAHALRLASRPSGALWTRRPAHGDAFTVAVGIDPLDTERPTVAHLAPGARLAVCGPFAHHAARAIVVQLATQCGPADLRLVVATHDADTWAWLADLPHLRSDDGPRVVEPSLVGDAIEQVRTSGAHLVVVTDAHEALVERTSALRQVLDDSTHALLAVLGREDRVPHVCTAVLVTDRRGTAAWRPDTATAAVVPSLVVGLGTAAAARAAASLARCSDPEDVLGDGAALPVCVDLHELLDLDAASARSIAAHWTGDPDRHDPAPRTTIGIDRHGTVEIDLVRDGPHALVAGTTGSGKSEFLRSLVVGLATTCSPQHLSFVLVDYKGGAAFDALTRLPHVGGTVTDLDDDLAERMLRSLQAELRRREELLRTVGAVDLTGYRLAARRDELAPHPALPRLVVIVDEFAALAAERPGFLHALVGIAQRGRSLGVHLVLATQRPGGMVADDIRANTTLRIALRLHEVADALDVVGDRLPVTLPRTRPGRAVVRVGGDEPVVVQTARCVDIERVVDRLVDAARLARLDPPSRPWLPPLPDLLEAHDVEPGAVGTLDDPDRQRRLPLRVGAGDGPLVVVGSRGAGVTSTLLSIVERRRAEHPHDAIHVIDATNDGRWTTLHDRRVAQLTTVDGDGLVRLVHRFRSRPSGGVTLVVDGIDELRTRLDTPAHDHRLEHRHETRLEQLLAALVASIGAGADVVLGAADPARIPSDLLARCSRRWLMHLDDPQRAATIGVPASLVPPAVPGRVRVDALLGQLLPPPPCSTGRSTAADRPAWWLDEPPATVWQSVLRTPTRRDRRTDVSIGLDALDAGEVTISIDDGEHLIVLGPRGSGRSAALTMLGTALGAVVPTTPIVVDDAERIDDRDGTFLRAVDSGTVSVIAAARGDVLRHRLGHWTAGVRRSRLAIVLVGGDGDAAADGELVGVTLPRRFPVGVRPGAAWLVDGSTVVPVLLGLAVRDHDQRRTIQPVLDVR